jgi:hypothetical protein
MRPIALALALSAIAPFTASPVFAQVVDEEKVNLVIVYGDDKCPESSADMITVCARKGEGERYRIPETLRESVSPQNEAWTNRVQAYETVTATGTMSCSPVGVGGWTGCSGKLIDQAYAEKRADPGIRAGELIAAEREKRLAKIDAEAAETQADVEQQEEQIIARRKLEQQASGTPVQSGPESEVPAPPKPN